MAFNIRMGLPEMEALWNDNTPSAGRMFWAYGPDQRDITVLAIEPHPEDQKRGAYQRIKLSSLPSAKTPSGKKAHRSSH